MVVARKEIRLETKGENDVIDITAEVQKGVAESGLSAGVVTVFIPGSTAAVTTLEFEPGISKDFPAMLGRVAPGDIEYEHQKTWNDGNGRSHVKAGLVGPSVTIPFTRGMLELGRWQQVVLVELDVRPRTRKVILQTLGE